MMATKFAIWLKATIIQYKIEFKKPWQCFSSRKMVTNVWVACFSLIYHFFLFLNKTTNYNCFFSSKKLHFEIKITWKLTLFSNCSNVSVANLRRLMTYFFWEERDLWDVEIWNFRVNLRSNSYAKVGTNIKLNKNITRKQGYILKSTREKQALIIRRIESSLKKRFTLM